ncbi:hypothetical protein GGR57DRAFT_285341 [Xylariaceae sp. FL1272]|nr:hypothetical protein GGR57DRAFT_285341 [Xylariaceae sp. FL1272]
MEAPLPPNESRATSLEALLWTEFGVATIFIVLRLATRHQKRSLGLDDGLMTISWVFYLATAIAIQFAAQASGGMRHIVYLTIPEVSFQLEVTNITLYVSIVCTALGKIAIGVTILRIVSSASASERWVVWVIILITVVSSVVDIFVSLFQCGRDPRAIWDLTIHATAKCLDPIALQHYTTFTAVWQAFVDFAFSVLPIFIVWRLRMARKRKIILTVGLGLTLLTAGVAAAKSEYIATQSTDASSDFTWQLFEVYALLSTEALLIIMCGSVPSIYPMWFHLIQRKRASYVSHESIYRRHAYKLSQLDSAKSPNRWWYSRSTADPSTELSCDVEIAMLTGAPPQPQAVAAAVSRRSNSVNDDLCHGKIHVVKEVELSHAPNVRSYSLPN